MLQQGKWDSKEDCMQMIRITRAIAATPTCLLCQPCVRQDLTSPSARSIVVVNSPLACLS